MRSGDGLEQRCVRSDPLLLGMSLAGARFGPWLGQTRFLGLDAHFGWPNFLLLRHLFPTYREVWFLLGLISGLVPSWYWDCNQLVEGRGYKGQKASVQDRTRGLWRKCAGEGAGSSHLYVLGELLRPSAHPEERPMRELPESAGSKGLKR